MLHGERYVYCNEQDRKNDKVQITTYIKASYRVEKAPSYRRVQELGYYSIYIRQEKDKHVRKEGGCQRAKMSDRRIEIRVPACELEALLKDAKLSYEDRELL